MVVLILNVLGARHLIWSRSIFISYNIVNVSIRRKIGKKPPHFLQIVFFLPKLHSQIRIVFVALCFSWWTRKKFMTKCFQSSCSENGKTNATLLISVLKLLLFCLVLDATQLSMKQKKYYSTLILQNSGQHNDKEVYRWRKKVLAWHI